MFVKSSKFTNTIRQNSHKKGFQTVGNTVLYTGLSITLLACSFATFKAIYPLLTFSLTAATDTSFQPTSMPWLQDKSSCHDTGRSWQENRCWDNEHSPTF